MITSRGLVGNVQLFAHCGPQLACELAASVSDCGHRDTIAGNPGLDEPGYDCRNGDILELCNLDPPGVAVDHRQQVAEPLEGGRGPTMSMFTLVNLLEGKGISRSSGTVCLVTLEVWHGMNSLHHREMSDCIPIQTHRLVMSLLVALVPAWERLCIASNTRRRNSFGTAGRGTPVDISHSNFFSWNITNEKLKPFILAR